MHRWNEFAPVAATGQPGSPGSQPLSLSSRFHQALSGKLVRSAPRPLNPGSSKSPAKAIQRGSATSSRARLSVRSPSHTPSRFFFFWFATWFASANSAKPSCVPRFPVTVGTDPDTGVRLSQCCIVVVAGKIPGNSERKSS